MDTIFRQLNLINNAMKERGLGKGDEKSSALKDADTNSQVSAITFMYTSSSLNSKKRPKDGI